MTTAAWYHHAATANAPVVKLRELIHTSNLLDHFHDAIETTDTVNIDAATVWNCYEGGGPASLTVGVSVHANETLTFSETGHWDFNLGISAVVVAGTRFGLSSNEGTNLNIGQTITGSAARDDIAECRGLAGRAHYDVIRKESKVIVFRSVPYYSQCTCTLPGGSVLENVSHSYSCDPFYAKANSRLIASNGPGAETPLEVILYNPGTASGATDAACSYCDGDLDPDGDEDGDGIPNGDDDTPYGYTGDDPNGDDDGDGIPNALDPTPYGYEGDDPWGDDDGDGIPNCQDPHPYGELDPVKNYDNADLYLPTIWLS